MFFEKIIRKWVKYKYKIIEFLRVYNFSLIADVITIIKGALQYYQLKKELFIYHMEVISK